MSPQTERLAWVLGLVGVAAAAVGVTVAITSKASTSPNPPAPPNPPGPPVPHGKWVAADAIAPAGHYRISVANALSAQVAALLTAVMSTTGANSSVWPPGKAPPADWPSDDTANDRWRADFVNTTGLAVPLPSSQAGDIKLWVWMLGA
jgi:hypothetical protein